MDYPAWLRYLHLHSLERRRLTADLILTHQISFGLVDVSTADYFIIQCTHGDYTSNPYKLSVNHCRINTRKNVSVNVL